MDTWLLLLPTGHRAAKAALRDLTWATGGGVALRSLELPGGVSPQEAGPVLDAFLRRNRQAKGLIFFDLGHLPLLSACPAWMRRVLVLDGLPGWSAQSPVWQLRQTLAQTLATMAKAEPIDACAPTSRLWAGVARLLFPTARILPPLPAQPQPVARGHAGPGGVLGTLVPADEAQAHDLAACLQALLPRPEALVDPQAEAPQEPIGTVLVDADLERQLRAPEQPLLATQAVTLPPGRTVTGGDVVLVPAQTLPALESAAWTAALAGNPLLVWLPPSPEDEPDHPGRVLDQAGAWVDLPDLLQDPAQLAALRARTVAARDLALARSRQAWCSLMGLPTEAAPEGDDYLVDDAVFAHWAEAAPTQEEQVRRQWLAAPADADFPLLLASLQWQTADTWQLVALAQAMTRQGAALPHVPQTLVRRPSQLFVSYHGLPASSWGSLQRWLASLPQRPALVPVAPRASLPRPSEPAIADLGVDYCFGLRRRDDGNGWNLSEQGAVLVFAPQPEPEHETEEEAAQPYLLRLALSQIGVEQLAGLRVSVAGQPVTCFASLTEDDGARLSCEIAPEQVRARTGLVVQLALAEGEDQPDEPVQVRALSLDRDAQRPDLAGIHPLHAIDLEHLPNAQGMFGPEPGPLGAERWVDAEFTLPLPGVLGASEAGQGLALLLRLDAPRGVPTEAPRQVEVAGQCVPLMALEMAPDAAWYLALLPQALGPDFDSVLTVRLDREVQPIGTYDARQAAALLSGAWVVTTRPLPQADGPVAPVQNLPLAEDRHFGAGWHGAEPFGENSTIRWMSEAATVFVPAALAQGRRLALVISGPAMPYTVTDVPLSLTVNGLVMQERLHCVTGTRWTRVFEAPATYLPSPAALEFTLRAATSRRLGESDERIASSLVESVLVVSTSPDDEAGEPVAVATQLVHEDWGTGLVGSWLPPQTTWVLPVAPAVAGQPAPQRRLRVQGSAATSRGAVEGLELKIDGQSLASEFTLGQDGAWSKTCTLPEPGTACLHLLHLLGAAPPPGADAALAPRVMLRDIVMEDIQA